ncbi:hypothetical protein BDV59DRAFT_198925 [Aspergillus ambiguus]|uniref:uncharacterized protein n=1 Tax=Aspergillus ambiguus TaxID=176160 RepID=UPI003CCCDD49
MFESTHAATVDQGGPMAPVASMGSQQLESAPSAPMTEAKIVEVFDAQIVKGIDTVEPDVIGFDEDHEFDIGPTTPQHVKDILLQYYESAASYADIPEELKVYEIDVNIEGE